MTVKEYRRLRRWEIKTKPAYEAGVLDGMDSCFCGEPRPQDILSEFDTGRYLRPYLRHAQDVSNAMIARARGRCDGWDHADSERQKADDEEWIEAQVVTGMAQLTDYLREAA